VANIIQKALKNRLFPIILRIATLVFFIFLIATLYLGSIQVLNIEFTSYWALFVVWTLWWPFLYVSLLFFSRIWCGFLCPIGLANEAGEKIRKGKTINIYKWGFIAYVLFFFIVLSEQISGLFISEKITLVFFALFFLAAFIFGILLARWSFCMLACPIGTLLGVFSRLSFLGLRTQEEKCHACAGKECLTGNAAGQCPTFISVPSIKSNKNCLLCARCIKNCPYDSPEIKFVKPGKEILDEVDFKASESLFIMALLGLTFILNSKGTQFFRSFFSFLNLNGAMLRTGDFIASIGFVLLIFLIINIILSRLFKTSLADCTRRNGYIYLPLVFSIMFFTIVFGFLSPYLVGFTFFDASFNFIAISKYAILFTGMIWSICFAYRLTQRYEKKTAGRVMLIASMLLISVFWLFYLIPGPLNMFLIPEKHAVLEPNQTLQMNAFSMGFDPKVITVKKGQKVEMSIKNLDVVHAFDIDEFDVHMALLNGKTTNVSFVAGKVGNFSFYCNVPGHTEAGMKGKLIVEE